jgi:hypothetical protein
LDSCLLPFARRAQLDGRRSIDGQQQASTGTVGRQLVGMGDAVRASRVASAAKLDAISVICTMLTSERPFSVLLRETRKPYDSHC